MPGLHLLLLGLGQDWAPHGSYQRRRSVRLRKVRNHSIYFSMDTCI